MSNPNPPRKPIGFGTPNSTTPTDDNDDFFGTPKKTSPSRKAATQKRDQGNQIKKDDFFDSASSNTGDGNISKSKYTNSDFNF